MVHSRNLSSANSVDGHGMSITINNRHYATLDLSMKDHATSKSENRKKKSAVVLAQECL